MTVDIGKSRDFEVNLAKGVDYDIVYFSSNSELARLMQEKPYTDLLVLRWGLVDDIISDKDHVSWIISSGVVSVPL